MPAFWPNFVPHKTFSLGDLNKTASLSQLLFHKKLQTKWHKTPTHLFFFLVDKVILIEILNGYSLDHLAECTCSSDLQQKFQCELWSCLIFLSLFSNNVQYIEHSSVLSHFHVSPGFFHLKTHVHLHYITVMNFYFYERFFLKLFAYLEKSKNI